MIITCGIDWSERHHDYVLMDETGTVVGRGQISPDQRGVAELLAAVAELGARVEDVPVAIETDKNLIVVACVAAGMTVYPINPRAVARYRERHRQAGSKSDQADALVLAEPFVDKIGEWVDRSDGRIRADVVHDKLIAMGYPGSERTTRRVVAAVKEQWRRTSHRVYMPWITEPGLWMQWDYAAEPMLAGQRVVLFVAWLAWSRFRVVVPLRDRTMPSVIAALDATF